MKAVICTKYGTPEVLKILEVAKPIPKDTQILIKVVATAVNSGDVRVKRLLSSLDRSKYKNPGMKFYDVSLTDTSRQVYSTKNIRGKYTLYDFWASWCGPCRANHPALSDFYNRNKNKGLEIVSISLDENEQKWKESILKDNLKWTQLVDLSGFKSDIAQYYGIDLIPFSLFVDANGKIVGANMTIAEMEHIMKKQ